MRRLFGLTLLALLYMAAPAAAQAPAVPADSFGWDEAAPSLAAANAYIYEAEIDNVVRTPALTAVCTGAVSPFFCKAPIPAVTPAAHTVRIRASEVVNGQTLVSAFSTPLSFLMRAIPSTPANVRIV